ncbi:hypothetical protein [Fusobacterium sp.]|uniref:hypothetical protein n=1 Tax=Fusobacterium sp. TaxID=68766 RepID=UPI002E79EBBC|nr:hypothetical protein [Fusobacterium sp.]MEE1476275.1 hypothetical protein [Fusobacterium sp.]
MGSQLVKKDLEGYKNVYPKSYITDIVEKSTGKSLDKILSLYNHIYMSWQGSVEETRLTVPVNMRRHGLWLSYKDGDSLYSEWFTKSDIDAKIDIIWEDSSNWERIPDLNFVEDASQRIPNGSILPDMLSPALQEFLSKTHVITNIPDDEDLEEVGNILKFKNKLYNQDLYSGLGYKILRKNWICSKNILTQDMISAESTIYEIRYDFDLNGSTINIPDNCVLYFKGGTFRNGTLFLRNTFIIPNSPTIEDSILASIKGAYIEGQLNYDKDLNTIKWYSGGKWNTLEGVKYGPTSERPVLNDSNNSVQLYYDTTINSLIYWNLSEWIDTRDGYSADILRIGYSDNRPSLNSAHTGFKYFDLGLNAYITWTGTKWIDINGYNPGERNSDGTLITKEIII